VFPLQLVGISSPFYVVVVVVVVVVASEEKINPSTEVMVEDAFDELNSRH
jgi:hypothetical protein